MDRFQFRTEPAQIQPFEALKIRSDRIYIIVFHAHKIPPHLGIIANKNFYSWKASGSDIGLSIDKVLHLIDRKNIATLIIDLGEYSVKTNVHQHFSASSAGIQSGMTCLSPINECLTGKDQYNKVGELLSFLERSEQIKNIFGAYLPGGFEGIPNYSRTDIQDRINYLRHGK